MSDERGLETPSLKDAALTEKPNLRCTHSGEGAEGGQEGQAHGPA